MASNTAQVSERDNPNPAQSQRARRNEAGLRAPVDIFEDSDSLVLIADMPGVSKERLDVRVDGNTLVLEGDVQFDLPEKAEAVYADVRCNGISTQLPAEPGARYRPNPGQSQGWGAVGAHPKARCGAGAEDRSPGILMRHRSPAARGTEQRAAGGCP